MTSSFKKKTVFNFHKISGPPRSTNANDYVYDPCGNCVIAVDETCSAYWSQNVVPDLYAHPVATATFESVNTDGEYIVE
jgi:hypothetical protein